MAHLSGPYSVWFPKSGISWRPTLTVISLRFEFSLPALSFPTLLCISLFLLIIISVLSQFSTCPCEMLQSWSKNVWGSTVSKAKQWEWIREYQKLWHSPCSLSLLAPSELSAVGQIKHAYTTAEKSAVLTGAGRTSLLQISEKGKISMGYTGD